MDSEQAEEEGKHEKRGTSLTIPSFFARVKSSLTLQNQLLFN